MAPVVLARRRTRRLAEDVPVHVATPIVETPHGVAFCDAKSLYAPQQASDPALLEHGALDDVTTG